MLSVPTEIVATGSSRTINVFWKEVSGATNYVTAVRPKNGTEPLEWVECLTTSSPHSISGKRVMSSLEYEVRVAAINADIQSDWSSVATVRVPALQSAPDRSAEVQSSYPHYLGSVMHVNLHRERPFENRSVWHWFMCSTDGTDCKLMPVPARSPTYQYRVPETAHGKLIKVQVDYDKGQMSYSATAAVDIYQIIAGALCTGRSCCSYF